MRLKQRANRFLLLHYFLSHFPELRLFAYSLAKEFGLAKEEFCQLAQELYSAEKEFGRLAKEFW
ncbi:hypothetical protein [Candidatus Electronema sp. PJ]|uniref:hypothetical protein n=1 Tax=Candidatus Electronema sp. PJ TaxID=3401572 RepID=UPI003AA8B116